MDESPPILHLLKAGRILQYRQQNVAIVSADEGAEFDIFYGERWLEPRLRVKTDDAALIVLADSPYERVDPIRYATVTAAERSKAGLQLTVKVGPYPVVDDDTVALAPPARAHPTGAPWFAWKAPADGLRPPRSDHEHHTAWRTAVDRLRGNSFYEHSRFARLVRVLDGHGHEVRERSLELGDVATAVIEVRSALGPDEYHSVLVDSDPPGTVAGGVHDERPDQARHLNVPVRPMTGGTHRVDLSFVPDPLLSTRLSFTLEAHKHAAVAPPPVPGEPQVGADPVLVQSLVERLRRLGGFEADQWLNLLEDQILPLAPGDPVVRSVTAEAAFDLGEHDTVVRLLDDPARFRGGDAMRRLVSGLHCRAATDVAVLLRQIDLGIEQNVKVIRDELSDLPVGALRQISEVILDELAGEEILDRLLADQFDRYRDDLALRVARECSPADPEAWLARALDRWDEPSRMPHEALVEILAWDIASADLAPYLRTAIDHQLDFGDVEEALALSERGRALLPRAEQVRLRISLARMLLDDSPEMARDLLLEAATESAGLGDLDLVTDLAITLREGWPPPTDPEVDATVERLQTVLDETAGFREWHDKRDEDAARRLNPVTHGTILHLVGGRRREWADTLATDLGLKDLRWHTSEKNKRPTLDWAAGVDPERDIVVLIWDHCGHATSEGLDRAGITYLRAVWSRASILEALANELLD